MTGPDRIWVNTDDVEDGCCPVASEPYGDGKFYRPTSATEYIRRDPAVLATLPEVQAMIGEAVAKERADCLQAAHDAVTHPIAYACVAAIRKRTEGKA